MDFKIDVALLNLNPALDMENAAKKFNLNTAGAKTVVMDKTDEDSLAELEIRDYSNTALYECWRDNFKDIKKKLPFDKITDTDNTDEPKPIKEAKTESDDGANEEVLKNGLNPNFLNFSTPDNFGLKDLEVVSNDLTRDDNGNVTKQVITRKSSDGKTVETTVKFDNKGRMLEISSKAIGTDGKPYDGFQKFYEYSDDGSCILRQRQAYTDEYGRTVDFCVYYTPIKIYPDGRIQFGLN